MTGRSPSATSAPRRSRRSRRAVARCFGTSARVRARSASNGCFAIRKTARSRSRRRASGPRASRATRQGSACPTSPSSKARRPTRLPACRARTRCSSAAGASRAGVLDAAWDALPRGGRLVVNAVTLETQAELIRRYEAQAASSSRMQIARRRAARRLPWISSGHAGDALDGGEAMTAAHRHRHRLPQGLRRARTSRSLVRRALALVAGMPRCRSAACKLRERRHLHQRGQARGSRPRRSRGDARPEARASCRTPRSRPLPRAAQTRSARVQALLGLAFARRSRGARRRGRGLAPGARRISEGGASCAVATAGGERVMTVHFIGAGPGAPDLITLRGRDLLARCPVCLYAGSLVPKELLAHCPKGARILDTAPLTLDAIEAEFRRAHDVGRGRGAAAFGRSLGLERHGRAIASPRRARHPLHDHAGRAVLRGGRRRARARAHLARGRAIPGADPRLGARLRDAASARRSRISRAPARRSPSISPFTRSSAWSPSCSPIMAAIARSPSCIAPPGRTSASSTARLSTIAALMAQEPMERTALILVGPVLGARDFRESALYDPDYQRRYRGGGTGGPGMSGAKRRARDERPLPIEDHDLERDLRVAKRLGGGRERRFGDREPDVDLAGAAKRQNLHGRIGALHLARRASRRRPPRARARRANRDRRRRAANAGRAGLGRASPSWRSRPRPSPWPPDGGADISACRRRNRPCR